MTEDQFEKLMLDIIKGFSRKNEKHFIQPYFRKLVHSNKQNNKNWKISSGRLIRESYE